ncbi:MAG: preprotein translocase subunit YajC [Companilactobacillus sp.]|uniref:preprotein translocase subunit YajC n=1 Tax=Companilactobacillus sp. TaxID=2767905 RepID=UPI0025B814D0|nr:preprotein translocase subunit YajC [Companilactobacillus sp.]MCH4010293.1 preprotein translocase subunit YajC [Companilactobacillus sp.]MCH4078235.1 preprotein translocase subunit YajC [Companilactobacillus sp.]MCH4126811.1 preprotein translocase subunit YajC [Companilactobacillus sp.]MCH4132650.1 preprotein translocase subunit YajC [Companilactobacillus sp.]MCI1343820.1 preprotein translocase subunit YajC [Companilactobacillus sp.]
MENLNILTLGAAASGGVGQYGMLIFIIILFVGMYFISIRPQRKQQQKRQEMLKEMSKGDKVVTLGGIKGTIESIDRDSKEVVVDCDGIYLTFDLNFIRQASAGDHVKDSTDRNAKKDDKPAEETKEADKSEDKASDDKAEESKEEAPKAEAKSEDKSDDTDK